MLFKINYIQVPMNIEEKTKVRNQGEISLITTIPKTYVKTLNIGSGDTLEWILNTETETLELKIIKWGISILCMVLKFFMESTSLSM